MPRIRLIKWDSDIKPADTEPVQETKISVLPWVLLSETLGYLDIHSQRNAQRVCSLWNALLLEPLQSVCVTLDLCNITATMPVTKETEAYIQHLLESAISKPHVKGLAINMFAQDPPPRDGYMVCLFDITSTPLLAIFVKNCRNNFLCGENRTYLYFELKYYEAAFMLRHRLHPQPGQDEWIMDPNLSYAAYPQEPGYGAHRRLVYTIYNHG